MVAVVRSVYDRKTNKFIQHEIIEELQMTEEQYLRPLAEIESTGFLRYWNKKKENMEG